MPSSVNSIASAAGLSIEGYVEWGVPVPEVGPGIYIVSLVADADAIGPTLPDAPLSKDLIHQLFDVRAELQLDGEPTELEALTERVAGFWLSDEVIVYIGLAGTSVRNRVNQYYRTPLGARKPHAGGWFLKLLSNLDELFVHYAATDAPGETESKLLEAFITGVSSETSAKLHDPEHPFPFANLEWPPGTRKQHGITGAKGERLSAKPEQRGQQAEEPRRPEFEREGSMDLDAINAEIQRRLRLSGEDSVTAVEAARWLDEAGLLKDSQIRKGLPLRNLLREGRILGQRQEPNHRWFIDVVD